MKPLGMIDGKIIELNENVVPMEDRGYQFGDGVYEVVRVSNGRCFTLDLHMERLFRSLKEVKINVHYTMQDMENLHQKLIKESSITEGSIYLQITRGVAPRSHGFPDPKKYAPRLTMAIKPVDDAALEAVRKSGVKILVIPDERWLRCDIKSLNLLPNVLGKQKAVDAGYYDSIMVRDGFITEGTSNNFWAVKDGTIYTFPISNFILKGITRTVIVDTVAPSLGIPVVEQKFSPDFLKDVQEAFLTGTITEVVPVTMAGDLKIGDGQVGPIARKIQEAYTEFKNKECQRKD